MSPAEAFRRNPLGPGRLETAADVVARIWFGLNLIAFSLAPVRVLMSTYMGNPNYSHGLLVPVVVAIQLWRSRARCLSAERGWGPGGLFPLALGCVAVVFGHWYRIALRPGYLGHVFLQGMGLLIVSASAVWMLAGRARFRILAPALGLLAFAVPWPDSFLLPVTSALQRMVAVCSAHVLRALGIEVFRDGNLLVLHSAVLGVAEACSGIRSLMAFFATAAACAAFLSLRVWRTLLLFVLVPVAAVGSNVVRIVVTSFLVLFGGDVWLRGFLHDLLGLAVVVLGGGILFLGALWLSRGSRPPVSANPAGEQSMNPFRPGLLAAIGGAMLLASTLSMRHVVRHYEGLARPDSHVQEARLPLAEFPYAVGQYRCTDEARLSAMEFDMLQPSEHLVRTYEDPQGNWVLLTVLYWEAQRTFPGSTAVMRYPHTPYSCMWGAGWSRETAYDSATTPAWLPGTVLYAGGFAKAGRERIVYFWNTNAEEDPRPFSPKDLRKRWRLLIQSWTKMPEGILPATYSVRVETDIEEVPAKARGLAIDFARQTAEILPSFGIGRLPGEP